jgi:AcrR family transcriptional regulator
MTGSGFGRLRRLAGRSDGGSERGGLDRDRMVRSALALLDEVGLDGLSMRRLADELGVQAASLYWHVRDKEELLDLLAEAISAEVPALRLDRPWREQLRAFAWGYRRALQGHRDAGRIIARRVGPGSLAIMDEVVRALLTAGFDRQDAAQAASLLVSFVPLFTSDPAAVQGAAAAEPPTLGGVRTGRLELAGGASRVDLRGDATIEGLYEARFRDRQPQVRVDGGTVHFHQRDHRGGGELVLNATIPWEIVVGSGASRLNADLRGLALRSFEVSGGASTVELTLPPPSGVVPVRFSGGVSKAEIRRPEGAPLQLRVSGGAARLALDDSSFGSTGGETRLQTPDFPGAADRYEVEVSGGAAKVTVGRLAPGTPAAAPPAPRRQGGLESIRDLPADRYPGLALVGDHLAALDAEARFRFGLEVLLDGLERRLGTAPTAPPPAS